jgi:hypothetical protein
MARSRRDTLGKARLYSDLLLYQATGGAIGKAPKGDIKEPEGITFGEKRGLLDSLIKIATMESKVEEPPESPFELMRRNTNGSKTTNNERNYGGESSGEDGNDESADSDDSETNPGEDLT